MAFSVEIQRYRYQDILDYEIDIDEAIYENHIQKLTLQPIVENALYHGIKNKRGGGMIRVEGRLERSNDSGGDIMVFRVKDTGIGMTDEELERLRGLISGEIVLDEQRGFGMANVQKRIEMMYGVGYGITVESTYNEGTTVTVRIPRK